MLRLLLCRQHTIAWPGATMRAKVACLLRVKVMRRVCCGGLAPLLLHRHHALLVAAPRLPQPSLAVSSKVCVYLWSCVVVHVVAEGPEPRTRGGRCKQARACPRAGKETVPHLLALVCVRIVTHPWGGPPRDGSVLATTTRCWLWPSERYCQ